MGNGWHPAGTGVVMGNGWHPAGTVLSWVTVGTQVGGEEPKTSDCHQYFRS